MKLKKLIGFIAVVATAIGMSTLTYAADENSVTLGRAIDMETNEVADTFEAGDIIAVPVDFQTTTDQADALSVVVEFNEDYIAADVDTNDYDMVSDQVWNNLTVLSGKESSEDNFVKLGNVLGALKGIYTTGRVNTYVGTYTYNNAYNSTTNQVYISWQNNTSVDMQDTPELYLIFRVKADVPVDELNFVTFTTSDTGLIKPGLGLGAVTHLPIDATESQANYCVAAFDLQIDSNSLPYWIQKLYVQVGDSAPVAISEYKTTDTEGVYSFPVRVTTNTTGAESATVTVLADTSTNEDGSGDTQAQAKIGTFEVNFAEQLPTDYTSQTVTAQ